MQVSCRPILLNAMKVSVQGSTALTVSQLHSDSSLTLLMSLQDDLKIYSAQAVIGCSVSKQLIDVGNYVQFNAATGDYGDMIEMGILDPAKVTRTALQAAGSVAGMMITTEAMVTDIPKDEGAAPAMPDMGVMGGMHGMM